MSAEEMGFYERAVLALMFTTAGGVWVLKEKLTQIEAVIEQGFHEYKVRNNLRMIED